MYGKMKKKDSVVYEGLLIGMMEIKLRIPSQELWRSNEHMKKRKKALAKPKPKPKEMAKGGKVGKYTCSHNRLY
jgi:hypothetical protein